MPRLTITLRAALGLIFTLGIVGAAGVQDVRASGYNCEVYGYSFPIDPNNDPDGLDDAADGIARESYYSPGGSAPGAPP